MNCRNSQSNLSAYLDGELKGVEMLAVRSHLHACPACAREFELVRQTKRLIGSMPDAMPSPQFHARLTESVFSNESPKRETLPWGHFALVGSLAAACAIAIYLRLNAQPTLSQPSPEQMAFDVHRDQAFMAGSEPFGGRAPIITANYPSR